MADNHNFDFISQPVSSATRTRMEIDFNENSKKQTLSQPPLQNNSGSLVDFMGDTFVNSAYYRGDEAPQSSVDNDDEEPSFEQESTLSLQREGEEFIKDCEVRDNTEVGQNIENMFDNYKQLGNDLERSILSLGNKNTMRKNELAQLLRNYNFIIKQKEKNKKDLVELQIQVENLDSLKQRAANDCETDKRRKLENMGQLFQSLFSNDEYIKNTQNKFKQVLYNDQIKFNSLLSEIKMETMNQSKMGENYLKELKDLHDRNEVIYNKLCEQEINADLDFNSVAQQCTSARELKELKEQELIVLSEKLKQLQKAVEESMKRNELLQVQLATNGIENNNLRANFSTILDEIHCEEKNIKERHKVLCETTSVNINEFTEKDKFLMELSNENDKLNELIKNILKEKETLSNIISEKELNIFSLKEEIENTGQCQSINRELNEIIQREKYLLKKNGQIENIISLNLNEREKNKLLLEDREKFLANISEKLSKENQLKLELETVYNEIEKLLENAKTKLMSSILTEKLAHSEEELKKVQNSLEKHEGKLSVVINEADELANTKNNIIFTKDNLIREQIEIEQKEKGLLIENDKQNKHLVSLENLKQYLTDLEENYLELKKSDEAQLNLDDLNEEFERITFDNNYQEQFNNTQLNSISDSFNLQVQNLNDQMRSLKNDKNKSIKKKIDNCARYRKTLPKMEEAILSIKNEMKEKIPFIIDCINARMQFLNQLIKIYSEASLEFKKKEKNNIDAKVIMSSVEKTLNNPMEHMLAICEGQKIISADYAAKFQQIMKNLQKKYNMLLSNIETIKPVEAISKLTEIAVGLFGGLGGLPTKASINENLQSSSITVTSDEITSI